MPRPPVIPADLLVEFGEPEQVFGPNQRFRLAMLAIGGASLIFGVLFTAARWNKVPVADWFSPAIAVAMAVGGVVVIYGAWRWPTSWVFVCPRGLVRRLGRTTWVSQLWSEAVRFEDATIGNKGIKMYQSRLEWKFGPDWGFIASSVADYDRLVETLRRKVDGPGVDRNIDSSS